jgi:hypothetical protein
LSSFWPVLFVFWLKPPDWWVLTFVTLEGARHLSGNFQRDEVKKVDRVDSNIWWSCEHRKKVLYLILLESRAIESFFSADILRFHLTGECFQTRTVQLQLRAFSGREKKNLL